RILAACRPGAAGSTSRTTILPTPSKNAARMQGIVPAAYAWGRGRPNRTAPPGRHRRGPPPVRGVSAVLPLRTERRAEPRVLPPVRGSERRRPRAGGLGRPPARGVRLHVLDVQLDGGRRHR